jgi:hypothetical protein
MRFLRIKVFCFLFLWVTILSISFDSAAQFKAGASLNTAFPFGIFSNFFYGGYGADFYFKYFPRENFSLGMETGYIKFLPTPILEEFADYSAALVPLNLTAEIYFFKSGWRPYIGSGVGISFLPARIESLDFTEKNAQTLWAVVPTGGILVKLNERIQYNLGIKYHILFTNSGYKIYLLQPRAGLLINLNN